MPRASAFDADGDPRSGAKLYFYEPSTLTAKAVYSDASLTTPITQPVTATSAGLWATIYMQASTYRVILKDANDVTIWDEDNYDPGLGAGFGVTSVVGIGQGGTGADNASAARANLGVPSSAAVTAAQDDITELQGQIAPGLNGSDLLGSAAAKDIGTSGDTVPVLNAANTFSAVNTFTSTGGIQAYNTIKAYVKFSVSGTTVTVAAGEFNVTNVSRSNEGIFSVSFTNNLPSANYVVVAVGLSEGGTTPHVGLASSRSISGFTLTSRNTINGSNQDPDPMEIMVVGY